MKAHLGYLHRRERRLLKKVGEDVVDNYKIERRAKRARKQAREVIFLA